MPKPTRRLTKASVLRALKQSGACPEGLKWFREQRGGLETIYRRFCDRPFIFGAIPLQSFGIRPHQWLNRALTNFTNISDPEHPMPWRAVRAAALRKGWWR